MGTVIAILNQKGGTGKTTTAGALAAGLTLKGHRTLAIDMDAQRNLSLAYGVTDTEYTIEDVLRGERAAAQCVYETTQGDIIPSTTQLVTLEGETDELGEKILTSTALKMALEPIRNNYDYIVLDCPPALSSFTLNALIAADGAIIVAGADVFSLQGIMELAKTIEAVRAKRNKSLKIMGILLARYNNRTILSRDLTQQLAELAQRLETKLFESTIRESIIVREAQVMGQSLFDYAPNANVTKDYESLIRELIGE